MPWRGNPHARHARTERAKRGERRREASLRRLQLFFLPHRKLAVNRARQSILVPQLRARLAMADALRLLRHASQVAVRCRQCGGLSSGDRSALIVNRLVSKPAHFSESARISARMSRRPAPMQSQKIVEQEQMAAGNQMPDDLGLMACKFIFVQFESTRQRDRCADGLVQRPL